MIALPEKAVARIVVGGAEYYANVDLQLEGGDEAAWQRPGLPRTVLRDLRRGRSAIEDELDLHGLIAVEARDAVRDFLAQAVARKARRELALFPIATWLIVAT